MIKVVVIAGGSETRLWPLSRARHPKQFLTLNSRNLNNTWFSLARVIFFFKYSGVKL